MLYDSILTKSERNALTRHTKSLRDEADLLRIVIKRQLADDGDQDLDTVIKCAKAIAALELGAKRMETRPDDALRLAFMQALNELDGENEQHQASSVKHQAVVESSGAASSGVVLDA